LKLKTSEEFLLSLYSKSEEAAWCERSEQEAASSRAEGAKRLLALLFFSLLFWVFLSRFSKAAFLLYGALGYYLQGNNC